MSEDVRRVCLDYGNSIQFELVARNPIPVWHFDIPVNSLDVPFDYIPLLIELDKQRASNLIGCGFRAVAIDRLEAVLRNGIDVEPVDSVIFVATFDKAGEYGGWPKLIIALN